MASLGRLTLDLVTQIAGFEEGMNKAERRAQSASQNITKSFDMASMAAKTFGGIVAGLTVGQVINIADEYTQMAAQIQNATKDTAEYDLVQKHLLETANTTYRSLKEAQQVYLDVGGALKDYGATTEQALRITDSLSFSFTHNATASDKAKSATDAFMKSIYAQKVGSQQWITILSAVPSIVGDIADSMGVSREEVLKLGNAGKITSQQLNTALDSSREKSEALANAMSNSFADGMNNLNNAFQHYVGEINKTYGITNNMAAALGVLAGNLDVVAGAAGVYAVALAAKMTPALASNAAAFATSTIESARYQMALARMSAQAAGTSVSLTVMSGAARAALTILGGPVGLALTVGTVAASYALFRDKTEESTASLRENNIAVSDAIEKYLELDKVKQRQQLGAEKEKLDELQKSYENTTTSLISYSLKIGRNSGLTKESARELSALIMQFKSGKISLEELSNRVNANNNLTQEQKDQFNKLAGGVRDAGTEFKNQKQFVDAISEALNKTGDAGYNAAAGIAAAATELDNYISLRNKESLQDQMVVGYMEGGKYSPEQARAIANLWAKAEDGQIVTQEQIDAELKRVALSQKRFKLEQDYSKVAKSNTREIKSAAKEAERLLEEQAQLRESIASQLITDFDSLTRNANKSYAQVIKANFSPELAKKYTGLVAQEYRHLTDLHLKNLTLELHEFQWTQERKLAYSLEMDQKILANNIRLTESEKSGYKQFLQEKYDFELAMIQKTAMMREFEYAKSMNRSLQDIAQAREIYGTPLEMRASLALQHSETNENRDNDNALVAAQQNLDMQLQQREITEQQHYARMQDALLLHEQTKEKIREDYSERFDDLMRTQRDGQLANMSALFSQSGSVLSAMTSELKNAAGEQSGIYRSMFLAQQALAIGSATINALQAYNQILASQWYLDVVSKTTAANIVLGMGMANVGLIASQTITGMAHSGIDNVPREGTWLLDKGERVLSPRQNADLTKYLNQKNAGGGAVGDINVQVVVNSDGTSSTDVQGDSKRLGEMIANNIRQVLIKEKRQGGLLA